MGGGDPDRVDDGAGADAGDLVPEGRADARAGHGSRVRPLSLDLWAWIVQSLRARGQRVPAELEKFTPWGGSLHPTERVELPLPPVEHGVLKFPTRYTPRYTRPIIPTCRVHVKEKRRMTRMRIGWDEDARVAMVWIQEDTRGR
jgi:hypothetical protein